jgi:hypothetical protein
MSIWNQQMDAVLKTGMRLFGRNLDVNDAGESVDNRIIYTRNGIDPFPMVAIPDIIPRLEDVDRGKFYDVWLRLKDFDDSPLHAYTQASFFGIPNNGGTLTFDDVTYTFVTTLDDSEPYSVVKGDDAADSALHLVEAINGGYGAGMHYSSLTPVHPTCYAVLDGVVCIVYYTQAGPSGNGKIARDATPYVKLVPAAGSTLSGDIFAGGAPLKGDSVTFDSLPYSVTDIGYDSEGAIQLRLELKSV